LLPWPSWISARTKAALAAAKARGVKLGNPNLRRGDAEGATLAREARARQARERAATVLPFITAARQAGASTLRQVADAMEARGIRSPSGGTVWHPATVLHVERMAA
jgi:DNA invertase Pin-like site-specific DNA recombinase